MTPRVLVRLKMKPESDGGRHAPFTEGYRPHLIVAGRGEWLSVTATRCPGPVAPGTEADVEFELPYHPNLDYGALQVGAEFTVQEGPTAIATGTVLEREDENKG